MSYESGTNGLGVGQRYNGREVGNVGGVTNAITGEGRFVVEFDSTDFGPTGAVAAQKFQIPEGNAVITKAYVDVEKAFDAGTVDVEINGVDLGPTAADLTSVEMLNYELGSEPTSIDATDIITVKPENITGVVGYAKVVVEFTRV